MISRLWVRRVGTVLAVMGTGLIVAAEFNDTSPGTSAAAADEPPLPIMELILPARGAVVQELPAIEVHFNVPVLGVEAADLLINGQGATQVTEVAPGQFVFVFPQPADGVVTVSWRPDHNITDTEPALHPFAGGSWTYALDSVGPASGLWISEFLTENRLTLKDEDGDYSDWIEIYNSNPDSASLQGWFLTDDARNPAKWRFPDVVIPGKGYLLVFASEKNKTNLTGKLHTNFKLSNEGEYLALVTPQTNIASEFSPVYPPQRPDTSFGRAEGDPQIVGYFTKPTPGAQNSASGPGFAPGIEFSRPSGTFTNRFSLELTCPDTNALVRYSLDGNVPTNSSPVYSAPLLITNSVQVRARSFQEGLLPGPVRSESFLLLTGSAINFTSDLPVLVIHALGKGTPTATRMTSASVSVYEPINGRTALTNAPTLSARAGLQLRGSSTEGIAKSSYKLELWDEFNVDQDRSLLGLPSDSDWVLYAPNVFEPVLIHNPFIHQLSRDMGRYSPRTRFVEIYFNKSTGPIASNHYAGIYVLEEKIKIHPERVAIDSLSPTDVKPPEVTGGYLLKIDRLDPGDSGFSAGGATVGHVDPKEREIKVAQRRPQQTYIRDYMTALGKALTSANWRDPKLGYPAYIDVPAWIDFHVLEVLSGNVDTLVLSTYFHKPRQGKVVFGPHWDFDRALGSTDGRDTNPRNWNTGPFFSAAWWSRLFTDKDFWQLWVDRWQELRLTHFSLANLHGLIDRQANEVRRAQPREYQKWRVTLRGGSYQSEINLMKNWVSNRIDYIDKQLTQPPRLSSPGGPILAGFRLTITGPAGATNYYTLDGSDPRAAQGGISPKALIYGGPIQLDANARVVVRARDVNKKQSGGPPSASSTPWSGPVAATFVVATPALLITEIMFHPAPPPAGSTNAAADFEFIELKNTGSSPLDLVGFQLHGDVEYTFTASSRVTNLWPGEHVLVVKNLPAFLSRYPEATHIAGEFVGSLDNARGHLTLTGPLLEPVCHLTYEDNWAILADGFGFSLVLADEKTGPDQLGDATRWRLSSLFNGSPGITDPPPPVLPRVCINEIVSRPLPGTEDAVELLNDTAGPVDISGWWLTDDFRDPKKYRLPPGSLIAPHGVLVIQGTQFGRNRPVSFGLNSLGDSLYLFSADLEGQLTGWYHGFEFGPQEQGTSFARWITSDRREHLAPSRISSLGRPNPPPGSWPVVLSEIMYQATVSDDASNARDAFIELADISFGVEPIALFDPAQPANTWRLRGAVDFDFPPGFRFPASRLVVVVSFDPQRDREALAGFRARYRLDSAVELLGPWRGTLSHTGATIRLLKPLPAPASPATQNAGIPYALVEEVDYLARAPWPADAAGTGRSIAPCFLQGFGNEPTLWISRPPTPGDTDNDFDGLPTRWETAHGLDPFRATGDDGPEGDPDHDNYTNLQEYLAGTSPKNAGSYPQLLLARDSQGWLQLSFDSAPSRSYTILYRTAVDLGPWQVLKTIIAPVEGGRLTVLESPTNSLRFYRLQTP